MDDTLPRYKAWETEAYLFVSIDVFENHTGIRQAALEGHTAVAARGPLVLVACALHHLAQTYADSGSTMDLTVMEDLAESFSFSETKKKSLATKFCTVLCNTVSDKTTLLEIGGIILPFECHMIFVTFAPTVDYMTRTALLKALRLVLVQSKKHFSKRDPALKVTSFISVSSGYIF